MKTFSVTYDFTVYKPSNLHIYEQQKGFSVVVSGSDLANAKNSFKKEFNKNPAYFKFVETNI